MLARTPEPELMTGAEQARAYAAADFDAPHGAIVAALARRFPDFPAAGRVVDLGCGPADIAVRVARTWPGCRVDAVDGSDAMLAEGRTRVARERLGARVGLYRVRLPHEALPAAPYDALVCNSLLHHLHDPMALWRVIAAAAAPGAAVFVADLARPATAAAVDGLVARVAGAEAAVLQADFRASLHAAFTPAEVRAQLRAAGLALTVEALDDHHLLAWGRC